MALYTYTHENYILRLTGDREGALGNARQAAEITSSLGEPPAQAGLASLAWCDAYLLDSRPEEAISAAREALKNFERAERANQGPSLAMLATAQLESGDVHAALETADSAIVSCRRSSRANFEVIAHGVRARALLRRDGAAAREAAEAAFTAAAALIEQSGAQLLAPALCEWRAELAAVLGDAAARTQLLREAEQRFAAIGAPLRAERIGRLLSAPMQ